MRSISIPLSHRDQTYTFCSLSGSLVVEETRGRGARIFPEKVRRALALCDNPYLLAPARLLTATNHVGICAKDVDAASRMAKRMHVLRQCSFLLACLYASYRKVLFDDCAQAIAFFNSAFPRNALAEACLQKSLFALKTARSFPSDGVLFVGIFLPTTSMHAWIVEANRHADPTDAGWVTYRPVFAYY